MIEMSDALSDEAKAAREKDQYYDAIHTIAVYVAERATRRPKDIRKNYLNTAYAQINRELKQMVKDYMGNKP
jgi:hypothetical protein